MLSQRSLTATATAKSLQLCLTLCDPIEGSPPGSPIPGILQARTLQWAAISSPMYESEKWKWCRSVMSNSWRPHGLQPTRLLCPWDFPGKSTGVGCHCLLHRGLLGCLHFFSFFLYSVLWQWFPLFCPPGHLSILLPQLFCYWLLIVYCSFLFICSLVLIGFWYTMLAWIFTVFLRYWIIFTIITLNSFSEKLPIPTSFSCFSGALSCPFIYDITFWFFILINFLLCRFCFSHCGMGFFLLLLSLLWWRRLRGLCKLPDVRD